MPTVPAVRDPTGDQSSFCSNQNVEADLQGWGKEEMGKGLTGTSKGTAGTAFGIPAGGSPMSWWENLTQASPDLDSGHPRWPKC